MILSVNQICKSYGNNMVLKNVSFTIDKPQIIALVGPNGSGKTTLLNIITNLIKADNGTIQILGKTNKDPAIFNEISFMQDNSVLYDYLTGYDHLQFIGEVQGISKLELMETAERVGMDKYIHKKVGKYSLGMKQHLLLTMALVNKPKLLILDEPLNGLDPTSAIRVRKLFLELYQNGTTVLLSSHNLAEIDRITSHVLFLKNGILLREDISQYEKGYYLIKVNDTLKAKDVLSQNQIQAQIIQNNIQIQIDGASLNQILQLFLKNGIEIYDLEKKVLGSEDRYQQLFVGDK